MPLTPYHFGPSGFIGLAFRNWLDIPVFVLANVVIDLEVLIIMVFRWGLPYHRYFHTLLIGAFVGAVWGAAAYMLRHLFERIMHVMLPSYATSLRKMIISGMLGACMHVLIDGAYHRDVRVFWPNTRISLWEISRQYLNREQIRIICVVFLIAAVVYLIILAVSVRNPGNNSINDTGEKL